MKKFEKVDNVLLVAILALACIGILMVLSSSVIFSYKKSNAPYAFFIRQIVWLVVGSVCAYCIMHVKHNLIKKMSKYIYVILTLILLALLLFGKEINGAKRWFSLGFATFQPAEFMKIVMILFLADYLDRKKSKLREFRRFAALSCIIGIPLLLIILQPDLGSVIVLTLIILSMFLLGGVKIRYIALILAVGLVVGSVEMMRYPYRRSRLKQYITQFTTANADNSIRIRTGVQQEAAIVALERGRWFGSGLGQSRLKLGYLPEPHTDFIFAIIGEEAGFIGSMTVITLFMIIFYRGMKIATSVGDYYSYLLTMGIVVYFSVQSAFHIGVSCGALPTKGLTLPFISCGGSSLVASLIAAGLLLKLSAKANYE